VTVASGIVTVAGYMEDRVGARQVIGAIRHPDAVINVGGTG
jgi:hypothetical protein